MAGSELTQRIAVAGVGIPCGVLVIYFGAWSLGILLSVVAAVGALEVYRIAEATGGHPFRSLGMIAAALLVLSAAWSEGLACWAVPAVASVMILGLVALVGALFLRKTADGPLASVATTVLGAVYVGLSLSFAVHLRRFPGVSDGGRGWEGALILIFPLAVTWAGDSAAYFSGRLWGRTKLLPEVSPGKTVAGSVGQLLAALLTAALFGSLLINVHSGVVLPLWSAAAIGIVIGVVAQIGDLAESLLKREAGLKDSGTLFPGHGGVLDRFDSILFTVPVTYVLLLFLLQR